MARIDRIAEFLDPLGRVILGYSGGIDSTLLAVIAGRQLGPERFLAVVGVSPSLATEQLERARAMSHRFHFRIRELGTTEMDDPDYRANPINRCYFCKHNLWLHLGDFAVQEGWDTIIDGTNAEDLGEHRPGKVAGDEAAVRSPLAELGWTKDDVRATSRELGIDGWDAPASPCLASRLRTGIAVTRDRLSQVEQAEQLLRGMDVQGNLRVRHLGDAARIEVDPEMFALVDGAWDEIVAELALLGFDRIERSASGYRRGALSSMAS